jgi:hypothetical protein
MAQPNVAKMLSDTQRMKNTPIDVCAKTAFVTLTTGIMSPFHLCALLGMGNFTKVVRVFADRE